MFQIAATPAHDPIHEIMELIVSPRGAEQLEAAAALLAQKIRSAPMWEYLRNQRAAGLPISDVDSMVKATALDILVSYSGDLCESGHIAGMFFTALHRAVETVLRECRLSGLIL